MCNDFCYRARVCSGSRLHPYTMCVQPREKIESVSHVCSAFYDNVRCNNRIARESMARCQIARHIFVLKNTLIFCILGFPGVLG